MKIQRILHTKWLENYKVKIFSALFAIFLWFYVVTDNQYDHVLSIPLRLINQPDEWILKNSIPPDAKVEFRGKGKDLIAFMYRDRSLELDLHHNRGDMVFPITVDIMQNLSMGLDVRPIRIVEPESLIVDLDRFYRKRVPVRSDLGLDLVDGFTLVGDVLFSPDSIEISGPRSLIGAIHEINTRKRQYSGLVKELKGRIDLVESPFESVQLSHKRVGFKADIQRRGEVWFTEIPIAVTDVPADVKVIVVPSTLSLKVEGGVDVLSGLKRENIVASIDYASRLRYKFKGLPAKIDLPKNVNFTEVRPQFFELIVER